MLIALVVQQEKASGTNDTQHWLKTQFSKQRNTQRQAMGVRAVWNGNRSCVTSCQQQRAPPLHQPTRGSLAHARARLGGQEAALVETLLQHVVDVDLVVGRQREQRVQHLLRAQHPAHTHTNTHNMKQSSCR